MIGVGEFSSLYKHIYIPSLRVNMRNSLISYLDSQSLYSHPVCGTTCRLTREGIWPPAFIFTHCAFTIPE